MEWLKGGLLVGLLLVSSVACGMATMLWVDNDSERYSLTDLGNRHYVGPWHQHSVNLKQQLAPWRDDFTLVIRNQAEEDVGRIVVTDTHQRCDRVNNINRWKITADSYLGEAQQGHSEVCILVPDLSAGSFTLHFVSPTDFELIDYRLSH